MLPWPGRALNQVMPVWMVGAPQFPRLFRPSGDKCARMGGDIAGQRNVGLSKRVMPAPLNG